MEEEKTIIQLKEIKKTYIIDKTTLTILKDISININSGDFIAIMGPSGSGKSTLMNILGCLDKPDSGEYILDNIVINKQNNKELSKIRNKKIGFIFQNYNLLQKMNAVNNVAIPMIYGNFKNYYNRSCDALSLVGLSDRVHHKPTQLSGGQQQRIAIARALINNPKIILADEPTGNLDTHTGEEIMNILSALNNINVTIVMVTHDLSISQYAKKIIHIRDGVVEYIENNTKITNVKYNYNLNENNIFITQKIENNKYNYVKLFENLKMGVVCLLSNKLRTALTMLGLIIGVGSLISMLAIGKGAYKQATYMINDFGPNIIFVQRRSKSKIKFTMQDVESLSKRCNFIKSILPSHGEDTTINYQGKHQKAYVEGSLPEYLQVRNHYLMKGNMFTNDDVDNAAKVVVIGTTVKEKLFPDEDPIGKFISVRNVQLKVIGILEKKALFGLTDRNNRVLVPLKTSQIRIFGYRHLDYITIEAKTMSSINKAKQEIDIIIRENKKISLDNKDPGFQLMSQDYYIDMAKKSTQIFTNLLSVIAAISLIVGGIGIMNIMLVSVTERTKEIGIRKALGATKKDILLQIIIETLILCFIGGVMGIIIGIGSAKVINSATKWVTDITYESLLLSFLFSTIVGLITSLYPAYKASNLNAIEALKYE